VAALGGAPGVVSARWAGPGKDFAAAMARVAREAGDAADRRAWFVCTLCLAWPTGRTATYLGRVEGAWVWPPRGERGFGYDPMFVPRGGMLTYGEMDPAAKHATSHRARAMAQFVSACVGELRAWAERAP
jgi:XTP/dITP diphosphohydrolase